MAKKKESATPVVTSLALTQADLNEEGIKTQLTQNDVLEVIVEEKYQEAQNFFKTVEQKANDFITNYNKLRDEIVYNNFLAFCKKNKITIPAGATKETINMNSYTTGSQYIHYPFPYLYSDKGRQKATVLSKSTNKYITKHTPELEFQARFDECINNAYITTRINTTVVFKIPSTAFDKLEVLEKEIETSKIESDKFVQDNKDIEFGYAAMLRQIKSTFNRELIKTGSPKLAKQIRESFGITI